MFKRILVCLLVVCGMVIYATSSSIADAPEPGWKVFGYFEPSNLAPGSKDLLHLRVYNIGAGETGANEEGPTLVDHLPEGVEAEPSSACKGTTVVTCQLGHIAPGNEVEYVNIPVRVSQNALQVAKPVDLVSVTGGKALLPTTAEVPVKFGTTGPGAGFSNIDLWLSNADGTVDTQAGSHPYELQTMFAPNLEAAVSGYELVEGGEVRTLNVNLPPGLVGQPGAVPECTRQQFDATGYEEGPSSCPSDTKVGEDSAVVAGAGAKMAVYNMVPPPGVAAQFAFVNSSIRIYINARVRSGGDGGITAQSNVPQAKVAFNSLTIWGTPGEHGTGAPAKPFLTLPTSCGAPPQVSAEMIGTWQNPALRPPVFSFPLRNNQGVPVGITGCERLAHFNPTVSLAPDTSFSDTPAGLTAIVKVPQGLNPEGLAAPGLKETTVTLPEGVVINPGQATGLVACQPWQEDIGGEGEEFDGPPSCPAASKVGTDEISTPLLAGRLKGNVYILGSEPPNLQLLVAASGEGVNLKLIGEVHLNEQTGQLTTTFKGTPQYPGTPDAPLNEFVLSFSGGAQAALVTPSTCGVYTSHADFTPWASPFVEDAVLESNFVIDSGPEGSGQAACTGPLPFTPTMTAGATTDQAGGYTDFSMLLQRSDGQQRVKTLSFKTPEGLLGMIAKVPLCQEPQAAQGTCSAASQIGHTVVGAGPGPYPFYIPQSGAPPAPIYLTGPYKGAPFGLSIVVPLIAGPFNLGTEVVRARIDVDPHTSQITVTTDALPTIIKGIPADMRSINAVIDRPEFMFNPTDCNPMSFSGTATSTEGVTAPLSSHFQMGSCQALKFQPNFKVSTSGKTSRTRGASLDAKIIYPVGNLGFNQASSQSNINSVKVDLPKQLPSRLTTLQQACPAATFQANPATCPAASIVGHAKAITPVLPVPLEGPAYFVSHASEEFPSLIVVLQGYGVTVELVGSTFINSKTNITSSTFKQVPDVPIGLFELVLPEGKYSALAANGNLCKSKLTMPTAFIAQNGAVLHQSTQVSVTGCTKAKKKSVKKHKTSKHKSNKSKGKK